MLAVELMDPRRSWELLRPSVDSPSMESSRVWVSPASPVFLADRQAVSPSAHSLPAPRGSMVRRQYTQPPHRRQGGSRSREAGWKAKEGAAAGANTSEERVACRAVVANANVEANNGSGCNGGRPRSREEEGRIEKPQGNRCGDSESGGGGGGGSGTRGPVLAPGLGGCGEAWGAAAAAAARNSECLLSGAGSCQGSKSSAASELWAWAGASGGAARGKAMLSAYGLQGDRHNPTCPRGNPGDGTRKHGRWQRGRGGSTGKADAGGGGRSDVGLQNSVGVEGDGAAQCREGCRGGRGGGGGGGRGGSKPSNRVSAGNAHNVFGGSGRKHRSVAARSKHSGPARRSRDHSSPSGRDQGVSEGEEDSSVRARQTPTASLGCREEDGSGALSMAASPRLVDSSRPRERSVPDGGRPADQIQRALEGLLVPAQGPTPSRSRLKEGPHQGTGAVATAAGNPTTIPAAVSGHVSVLTMDGRGGSAAPPYRPQQLTIRAPTTASCAPVLPGLAGPGGSGMAMIAAFEAETSCGQQTSVDGGDGGDDHSTPPVSRQRAHSHHSPWHARKHPRGIFGGRGGGGGGIGRSHHGHQEHPNVGEKTKSGSGGRPGVRHLSEPTPNGGPFANPSAGSAAPAEAVAGGNDRSWAVPPIALAKVVDEAPDARGGGLDGPREPPDTYPTATSATQSSWEHSRPTVTVGTSAAKSTTAADGGPPGGLDPFDRLLHGAAAVLPQSELIDHYKLAPRPKSRRGTRNQGVEGQSAQPEPAFSLFSRKRDGVACGSGRAAEGKEQRGEEEENEQRE